MLDLRPNQRAINRFIGELTRNWDTSETLEIRCIRENLKLIQHALRNTRSMKPLSIL